MWFYRMVVPHCGDNTRWHCGTCIQWGLNKERNCGGRYPNSKVAKEGYEIAEGVRVFECPKTAIKERTILLLRYLDSIAANRPPNFLQLPAATVEYLQFIERENEKIDLGIQLTQQNKRG